MFVKGQSGNPAGRKRGVKSKNTLLKAEFLECINTELGGAKKVIAECYKKDPVAVLGILAKLMPKEIEADVTGDLVITWEK